MSLSWFSSLRGRLIASYVVVLVLALAFFGTGAVFVIDHDLHTSLDSRLQTTAAAVRNFVDLSDGKVSVDEHDREQIFALLGSQIEVAILGDGRNVILTSAAKPSPKLLALAQTEGFADIAQLEREDIRALSLPIKDDDRRVGTVLVWTAMTWIRETDRRLVAAFALAALVLAAVASVAGAAITRKALEDAFARQRRFTADASHELRAPLSVIRAEADLALRKPRECEAYRSALATIVSEADRLESLVSSLLSAVRTENVRIQRTLVDLSILARRVSERFQPAAAAKELKLAVNEAQSCQVKGSADALESAVAAIIHNAIKHAPAGSRIDISTLRNGKLAEILVHDDGAGFSDEALVHGLEWFWCGDTSRSKDGSGLGLAIADSIATSGGGRITLANPAQGGAQVTISLPLAENDRATRFIFL